MASVLEVVGREVRDAVSGYVGSAAERWDHIYARGFGEATGDDGQRARHYVIAGIVADLCDPGARVLDVGSGFGTTYRLLRRIAPVYHGVDISSRAVQRCRDRFGDDPLCTFQVAAFDRFQPSGAYDAIILNQVLHGSPLRGIRAAVDKAVACLAGPRAVLVIATQSRLAGPLLWAAARAALPAPRQHIRVRTSPLGRGWTVAAYTGLDVAHEADDDKQGPPISGVEAPSTRWRERVS